MALADAAPGGGDRAQTRAFVDGPRTDRLSTGTAVLAVAIPVAVAVAPFLIGSSWTLNPDGSLYAALATSIRTGQGYAMPDGSLPLFRPPLLPALISAVWAFTGPSIDVQMGVVRVFQIALTALAGLIALRLSGRWAGLLAGLLVASAPVVWRGLGTTTKPDGVVTALVLAAILTLMIADDRRSTAIAVAAGVLTGLAFGVKQTGLVLLLLPIGMIALEGLQGRGRIWTAFLLSAAVGPLAWYTVAGLHGAPPMGASWLVPLGWVVWLTSCAGVVRVSRGSVEWVGVRRLLDRRGARTTVRVASALAFVMGLVAFALLASRERIEIPTRMLDSLAATLLADLDGMLPGLWLLIPMAIAVVFALLRPTRWRYVALALIASLPIAVVAWRYDLRDSQYLLSVVLGLILVGALPAGLLHLGRGRLPDAARSGRLIVASVMPALVILCVFATVWPNAETASRVYGRQKGSSDPRYQTMVAAASWLEQNVAPGTLVGYDDEPIRQVFFELGGTHPMSMVPQVFVRPDEGADPLPMAATGWVDVGKLGAKPPTPVAPLIKLLMHKTGRYYAALEGDRLLEWLRDPALAYLVVTQQTALGLGAIEPYLASQPGLRVVWQSSGEYSLVIYSVDPSEIVDIEFPLFATPAAIESFALGAGTDPEALVAALNGNGWFPTE